MRSKYKDLPCHCPAPPRPTWTLQRRPYTLARNGSFPSDWMVMVCVSSAGSGLCLLHRTWSLSPLCPSGAVGTFPEPSPLPPSLRAAVPGWVTKATHKVGNAQEENSLNSDLQDSAHSSPLIAHVRRIKTWFMSTRK